MESRSSLISKMLERVPSCQKNYRAPSPGTKIQQYNYTFDFGKDPEKLAGHYMFQRAKKVEGKVVPYIPVSQQQLSYFLDHFSWLIENNGQKNLSNITVDAIPPTFWRHLDASKEHPEFWLGDKNPFKRFEALQAKAAENLKKAQAAAAPPPPGPPK
mmetsp:Transcript_5902/g.8261  ORF Transcript_5902/g.8261 Transcript_5902/m.8261 type:complete len:157 (-) Transcript_5902:70-540(-)